MDVRNRLVEYLVQYNSHSEGLLAALYNYKIVLDPEGNNFSDTLIGGGLPRTPSLKFDQPKLFGDPQFQNVIKTATKKFPVIPDLSKVFNKYKDIESLCKIQGFQALLSDSKTIFQELLPIYQFFKELAEFNEIAPSILLSFEKFSAMNVSSIRTLYLINSF